MSSYFEELYNELSEELSKIKPEDFIEPEDVLSGYPSPNDCHKVGVASDEIKRIFTLWRKSMGMKNEHAEKSFLAEGKKRDELLGDAIRMRTKAEALNSIFWHSVRKEFNLWDKTSIGISKGFIIFWIDKKEQKCGCPLCKIEEAGGGGGGLDIVIAMMGQAANAAGEKGSGIFGDLSDLKKFRRGSPEDLGLGGKSDN